jgi:hypothetical protein
VDASRVFLDVCGDYELMYSVQAGQGETEAVSCMVFVRDSDHLQQLIDSHVISVQSAYIAGADNPYDSGVFTEESMEAVLEQTKPAFVSLSCTVGDRQLWGSGFILSVDDETVDIVTNAHVVSAVDGEEKADAEEQTSCQVRFFTGDEVQAVVCRVQESPDMALLQVAVKSLPAGLLEQLRTVHVEKDGDKEEGTQIGCCYFDRSTGQWEKAFGELMGTEEALWAVDYPVVRYTLSNVPGSSGSAVLDSHGNLTAMVLGNDVGEEDTAYYGIRVEDILLFYAEAKASSDSPEQ